MFKNPAKAIAELQAELGQVDAEGKEINQYGLEVGFAFLANCILTLMIGLALRMLPGAVIYTASFFLLRRYTGGFHMRSHFGCMAASAALEIAALCLAKFFIHVYAIPICLVFTVIGGALILLFAPVESINKPLDPIEVTVYRKRSKIVLLLFIACIIFLTAVQLMLYTLIISLVLFEVGLSVIFGRFITQN